MKQIKIENKIYENILFVFAMKEEASDLFNDCNVLFTGLGKINATYELTKYLDQNPNIDLVINLGTAGSNIFDREMIVNCTAFVQRDMDVTSLGFDKYVTPFSQEKNILKYGISLSNHPKGTCGSGDNFDTSLKENIYNVVDMEAYALAFVCKKENIDFICLKYISDGADDSAANDWNLSIKKTAMKLKEVLFN